MSDRNRDHVIADLDTEIAGLDALKSAPRIPPSVIDYISQRVHGLLTELNTAPCADQQG